MIRTTTTIAALLVVAALAPRAAAQPCDDPHLVGPCEITCRQVIPCEIIDEPYAAAPLVQRPAPRAPSRRGPEVQLGAGYGYGGAFALFGDRWSGPVATASLSIMWPPYGRDAWVGLRLLGSYGHQMSGTRELLLSSAKPLSGWHATYSAALAVGRVFNERVLGDIYLGLGAMHVQARILESGGRETEDDYIWPELTFGSGLVIHLTRFLDLRLAVDLGTFFFVTWRLVGSGGLVLRF
jgi:hypothetical protein